MTDDRRRAAGLGPASAEPDPGDTLPFGAQVHGSRPPQGASSSPSPPRPSTVPLASGPLPATAHGAGALGMAATMAAPVASQALGMAATMAVPAVSGALGMAATMAVPAVSGAELGSRREPGLPSELPVGTQPPPKRLGASRPGPQPERELPYAPTVTPRVDGATRDMLPPSGHGASRRGSRASAAPPEHAGAEGAAEALSLEPGQRIGRFVIRKRLGEGGMGVVLAGHDPELARPVAIKLVRADVDRPAYRARLMREAQAMARLEHPNVVRLYEVGSERGRLFVAMELVDGVTLTEWLAGRRRPWREVLAMFAQIGAGLAAVHRTGLVHRDFKPDNVLIDRAGRARVADLGLARLDPEVASPAESPAFAGTLTRSGVMMGTPGYMAPEQQAGSAVDARADQYSYCIALREALLGGRVVRIDWRTWRHVPRAVRRIVERGLAFEPGERFASMDELLGALGSVERRRGTVLSAGVAALAIAGGITTTAILMSRDRGPRAPVQPAASAAPAAAPAAPAAAPAAPAAVPAAGAHAPRRPESWPTHPGHLAIVSATVQGLGYDGFDPGVTASEVEALSGIPQGVAKVKLGMVERRAGRCAAAVPLWTEARQVLPATRGEWSKWSARAAIGQSLCALAAGRPDEANRHATAAGGEGNQDELRFLLGLVFYEQGQMPSAQAMLASSRQQGGPTVRAALQIWLERTGLTLP